MSQGYSFRDLWDYEDGVTLPQLISLNVEAGRLALVREKQEVNAMTLALSSLFDQKVLAQYNQSIDAALRATRMGQPGPSEKPRAPTRMVRSDEQKARDAEHSVQELSKLNVLLMGGGK